MINTYLELILFVMYKSDLMSWFCNLVPESGGKQLDLFL